MLSYEFKPDAINEVVPSPRYVDHALKKNHEALRIG